MGHGGGCGDHGSAALAGLVGEDAALDTHHYRGSEDAAGDGLYAEGAVDYGLKHGRDRIQMLEDDEYREYDVSERHERRNDRSYAGDALDATDDDQTQQESHSQACRQRWQAEGIGERSRHSVGLDSREQDAVADDGEYGKQYAERRLAKAVLDVAGGATPVAGGVVELEHLREGGLHEGGRGSEESNYPHPEHGPGPAQGYGRGHTDDVSGADTSRQGDAEGLEGGDAVLAAGLVRLGLREQRTDHHSEAPYLDETRPNREIEAGTDQEHHQQGVPYDVVDDGYDSFKHGEWSLVGMLSV